MKFDKLSNRVIGCAIEVHRNLGPGLLESTYERCLSHELTLAGIPHEIQKPMPVRYEEVELDCGYRLDILVDDKLVVELKSVDHLLPIHEAQLLTYLKLGTFATGLLINFNVPLLPNGLKRMVL